MGVTIAQDAEGHGAAGQLEHVATEFEFGNLELGHCADAEHIRVIELQLRPRLRVCDNGIADHDGRILGGGDEFTGIATAEGYVSVDEADPGHATARAVGV